MKKASNAPLYLLVAAALLICCAVALAFPKSKAEVFYQTKSPQEVYEETKDKGDIAAYIYFPDNSRINYPVMKWCNDKYLYADYTGKPDNSGTPYFSEGNNDPAHDQNLIIFGHNMLDGSKFGSLSDTVLGSRANDKMILTIDGKKSEYRLFSICTVPANENVDIANFKNEDEFRSYVSHYRNKSMEKFNVPVTGDQIATLITCTDYNDFERLCLFYVKEG